MYAARRKLAAIAAAHCRDTAGDAATHTITIAGAGTTARRHALDLTTRITGVTATQEAPPQPDTLAFALHGTTAAVFIAAECMRLLQTQLDWSIAALGMQTAEFTEAMATGWMNITAEQLDGVAL